MTVLTHPAGAEDSNARESARSLQKTLASAIDLALQAKQAHWNVVGHHFRSAHLQLDEVVEILREATDEIAERIATLGVAASGNAADVAEGSALEPFPHGFQDSDQALRIFHDRLQGFVAQARELQPRLAELDPVSEDLVIGILGRIEKAGWMLQAQFRSAD